MFKKAILLTVSCHIPEITSKLQIALSKFNAISKEYEDVFNVMKIEVGYLVVAH